MRSCIGKTKRDPYDKDKTLKDSFLCLAEVKVEGGRLVAIENKKGR